jgi:hypothetical protein
VPVVAEEHVLSAQVAVVTERREERIGQGHDARPAALGRVGDALVSLVRRLRRVRGPLVRAHAEYPRGRQASGPRERREPLQAVRRARRRAVLGRATISRRLAARRQAWLKRTELIGRSGKTRHSSHGVRWDSGYTPPS